MNRLLLIGLVSVLFFACNKSDSDEKLAEEERNLEQYMKTNFPDAIKTASNTYIVKGKNSNEDGKQPDYGDYVLVNYTVSYWDNGNPNSGGNFESTSYSLEEVSNVDLRPTYAYGGPELWLIAAENILSPALKQIREGESVDMYASSKYAYLRDYRGRIYHVNLITVIPELTLYQDSLMSYYLQNTIGNKVIDTLDVTGASDGKKYHVFSTLVAQGSGNELKNNDAIKMQLNASYLLGSHNARVYLSDKEMTGTITEGHYISKLILKHAMHKGGRLIITMPYKVEYPTSDPSTSRTGGFDNINENNQYIVPPNSVLVYDITINP